MSRAMTPSLPETATPAPAPHVASTAQPTHNTATCGVVMPREVVAWLQTLGLSRAIKHPRRDMADGCLVAEVCARYWRDVPLHSFERRTSVQQKLSNWSVLRRIFARHDTALSERVIAGMVQSRPHYAEAFLLQLYTLLTGRQVHMAAPLPYGDEVVMPPYNPRAYSTTTTTTTAAAAAAMTATRSTAKNTMMTQQPLHNVPSSMLRSPVSSPSQAQQQQAQQQQQQLLQRLSGNVAVGATAGLVVGNMDVQPQQQQQQQQAMSGAATQPRAMRAIPPVQSMATQQQQQQQQQQHGGGDDVKQAPVRLTVVNVQAADTASSTTNTAATVTQQQQQQRTASTIVTGATHDKANAAIAVAAVDAAVSLPSECIVWLDEQLAQLPLCRTWPVGQQQQSQQQQQQQQYMSTAHVCAADAPYLSYLLQHGDVLEAEVLTTAWATLLLRVDVLVRHVQRTPAALTTLTHWFALPSLRDSSSSSTSSVGVMSAAGGSASVRAVSLLTAVLTQWCDVDADAALAAFVHSVLGVLALRTRLRTLCGAAAAVYAPLMCAVVPRDRSLAHGQLRRLLSAVGEAVLQRPCSSSSSNTVRQWAAAAAAAVLSADADAAVSYLVLLRAMTLHLLRTLPPRVHSAHRAIAAAASSSSPSPMAAATRTRTPTQQQQQQQLSPSAAATATSDGAFAVLYHTVAHAALAALTSPSSSLRLLGAALAVTLLQPAVLGTMATTTTARTTRAVVDAEGQHRGSSSHSSAHDDDYIYALHTLLFAQTSRQQTGVVHGSSSRNTPCAVHMVCLSPTDDPWLHVQRAMWLRRWYACMTSAMAAAHAQRVVSAATMTTTTAAEAALRGLCALLRRRGVVAAPCKAQIAYEVACLLPHLPCSNSSNDNNNSDGNPTANASDVARHAVADEAAQALLQYYAYEASDAVVALTFASSSMSYTHAYADDDKDNNAMAMTMRQQQQQQQQQYYHRLLGCVAAEGCVMRHSSARLLTAAVLTVLPPTTSDDRHDAVRRLHARAALLARDRVPSAALQQRIMWLYRINCTANNNSNSSGSCGMYGGSRRSRALLAGGSGVAAVAAAAGGSHADDTTAAATTAAAAVQQQHEQCHWHALLRAHYADIALVTTAAEMAVRQQGGAVRANAEGRLTALLTLAGRAQRVVLRWYRQCASSSAAAANNSQYNRASTHNNSNDNDDNDDDDDDDEGDDRGSRAARLQERLARAMSWYHDNYKEGDV